MMSSLSVRARLALVPLDDRITPTLGFTAPQSFTTGNTPYAVAVGDFNGDGNPDLATADFNSGNVSIQLNITASSSATATFAAPVLLTTSANPSALAVGDFNGDGRVDLAVAGSRTNDVSVFRNTTAFGAATATFAAAQAFAVGRYPTGLAAGDFDGDGRTDLIAANYSDGTASVLRNGTGVANATFVFSAQQAVAVGNNPYGVTVTDFNADGRADFAVTNASADTVSVLLNATAAGSAVPAFAARLSFATGSSPRAVTVGDFNGDGRPDLATADFNGNTVSVLSNTTTGTASATFSAAQTFAVGNKPQAIAVADFDGDGRSDIATADFVGNTASVLLNTATALATTPAFAAVQPFAAGTNPATVAVADLNGDGRPDLVTATGGGQPAIAVRINTSTGGTATPVIGQFGATGVWGYDRTANTWVNLDTRNATALAVSANGNAVASFGAAGTWYYRPLSGWVRINGYAATALAIDPFGNAYASFAGFGTAMYRAWANHWLTLGTTTASASLLAVAANGDVFASFAGAGVSRFRRQTGWVVVNGHDATALAVDPNGFAVASFNGFGIGQFVPFANGWRSVSSSTATALATDGFGNLYAGFAAVGLRRWSAATVQFATLSSVVPVTVAADWYGNITYSATGSGVREYRQLSGENIRRTTDAVIISIGR